MPVRNGGALLSRQLEALVDSIGDRNGIEVVVADNGSTDDTVSIAQSFIDRLDIHVVDASRSPGINVARNEGVRASNANRILLCDADDEVDSEWIGAMATAFDQGSQLLAGVIDYTRLNDATARRWRGADRASVYQASGFLPAGHGANTGFTRAVFDAVGSFDEAFRGGGDDTDFFWRAQIAGFELLEVPDGVVHYRLRPSLRDLWHQNFNYATSEAQLGKKFISHGLHHRPWTAPFSDLWWLVSRAPFVVDAGRRGAWVRRLAVFCGRFVGSFRHRVLWW